MERFAVFRAKDPQVTMWLQKNGFQNRRSEGLVETRAAKTSQISREETKLAAQTKEVRFYAERQMQSKTTTLVSVKKTATTEQERNEVQHHERLSSLEMPTISFSKTKRVVYQNKEEPSLAENINTDGRKKIRSYSCPPDSRPSLISRRYSTVSLFSDRPCNIPVLIRNNDVRLRKYSCPEYYSTGTNYYMEQRGSSKLNKNPQGKRTALNAANNSHQQLASKLGNQTTREENETKINNTTGVTIKPSTNLAMVLKTELSDFSKDPATDHNGNERFKPAPNSTSDDDGFGLVFHEQSLESYSSEIPPKRPTKQNLPSSMYNSRGNMLAWLGEVNRNIYPQIRS